MRSFDTFVAMNVILVVYFIGQEMKKWNKQFFAIQRFAFDVRIVLYLFEKFCILAYELLGLHDLHFFSPLAY